MVTPTPSQLRACADILILDPSVSPLFCTNSKAKLTDFMRRIIP
ncbi:hypothetical protein D029_0811 [Vibrio parahaemolyticus 970107]|nr:hypothetical protein D029_0811 [Vibrio parahaemolyticus 970107]